tara:strand:+ start:374 stop:1012 length:639 start_codon:yes stop_codon:yes gene_type:complete
MKYSAILSSNYRSFSYIKLFIKNKLFPRFLIYLDNKKNNRIKNKIIKFVKKNKKIKIFIFKGDNIDDKKVKNFLLNLKEKIFVYSGYPGKIIKSNLILKKFIFLHSHTGKLPNYKGSTTIYYSLLKEKKIFCSTFIMGTLIDQGKILFIKNYPLPKNLKKIDEYDSKIRSINTLIVLKNLKKLMKKKIMKKNINTPYYIMHPVLRYLTLKKI